MDGVSALKHYRLLLSFLFAIMAAILASSSSAQSEASRHVTAVITSSNLSNQEFHCNTGYVVSDCKQEITHLKAVLGHYPARDLGHWTWVLVRSEDWKPILRRLRLNEDSPAFSALEQRETFLEESLFGRDALHSAELMRNWQLPLNELLNVAVTHELGHALCGEADEAVADHFGERLRRGQKPPCRVAKATHSKSGGARVIARN